MKLWKRNAIAAAIVLFVCGAVYLNWSYAQDTQAGKNLGEALDEMYAQADACYEPRVKLKELTFSLSGMENQVKALAEEGEKPANIARFAIDAVSNVVWRATQEAQRRYPGLPVLCSGGVASNSQLRSGLADICGAIFAQPKYSTDNAMGTAILTWRGLKAEERP